MATVTRIPISITLNGNSFTATLSTGGGAVPVNVLLDTGSSLTAVNLDPYDPGSDPSVATSQLLYSGSFQSSRFMAAVVRTPVHLQADAATPVATVPAANVGVVYDIRPNLFGNADGILGLAYQALNPATRMPADTMLTRYGPTQLGLGQKAGTLAPYLDQLVAAGQVPNKFAFAVRRSIASGTADTTTAESLNTGVFVIGDAEECTDLYTGTFVPAAVVHEAYYNTNLVAIQVGTRTIQVQPTPAGSAAGSNSFLDSGNSALMLDPPLYAQVITLFDAVNPAFGPALQSGSHDQTQLDLAAWPPLRFVLQGTGGAQATVTVQPQDYWQFDGYGAGTATAGLTSGGAPFPGQSILGLPIFAGRYVVFDRTGGTGRSVIKFANQPPASPAPLVA
jgi:hypothetical protein